MLKPEIEPFADAHIAALESVEVLLKFIHENSSTDVSQTEIEDAIKKLISAQRGFYRFKVCMLDEVKMKDRYYEDHITVNFGKD